MNRVIKFKCWDGVKLWQHAVPLLAPAYNGGSIKVSDYEDGSFNSFVNGKLLQYTGLNDDSKRTEEFPDGKEVYEGDIVKKESHTKINIFTGKEIESPAYEIGVVEFLDGCFIVKWTEGKNSRFGDNPYPYSNSFGVTNNYVKVIGNIYETKDK